jgi:hypothetical protein
MNEIFYQFLNTLLSGFVLGISFWNNTGLLLPYIISTQNDKKSAINSIVFVLIGRLTVFTFLGGIYCRYPEIFDFFQNTNFFNFYSELILGLFLFIIGIFILLSVLKKYKFWTFLYKYDHFFMLIFGILFGISSDIKSRMFFVDLFFNCDNYILGTILSFFYGLSSCFSPVILIVIFFGYIIEKFNNFSIENNDLIKISDIFKRLCGMLMIFFGFFKIFRLFSQI